VARPSEYTLETALLICERLVEGESLRSICTADDMPGIATVFRWLDAHEQFREHYARARDCQADTLADEILQIADTPMPGVKTKITEKGTETIEGDMIEHRRLQVDTRKWIASKLKPKKYSDRVDHSHSGPNGGPIVISSTDAEL